MDSAFERHGPDDTRNFLLDPDLFLVFHSKYLCTCFMAAVFLTVSEDHESVLPLPAEVTDAAASHSLRNGQEFFLIWLSVCWPRAKPGWTHGESKTEGKKGNVKQRKMFHLHTEKSCLGNTSSAFPFQLPYWYFGYHNSETQNCICGEKRTISSL